MEQTLAFYINLLRGDFIQFCAQRLKELGLSQGLLYFLLYVGRHPGCSAGELASVIGVDSGHTTRSVEKLVQQGFMTRTRSQQDKRGVVLELTEQGRDAFVQAGRWFYQWEAQRTEGMSPEEVTQLKALLQKAMAGISMPKSPMESAPGPVHKAIRKEADIES